MKGVSGLRYDYGQFYASKTFFDSAKNRRILWGWINESCIQNDDVNKGWSGLQADVEISFEITDLEKAEMPDSSWTNPQLLCSRKINHSTVESFGVGGKACITARVYPILATDDRAQRYAFNCGN
ncbi:Beta-fructofuranosidase insoluble isoenzyme CWINV1 [Citrus sinensis]|nr:Beta-fructofuranosidase insoluble isoenzyme CWINV1 [Citrus sinensis]